MLYNLIGTIANESLIVLNTSLPTIVTNNSPVILGSNIQGTTLTGTTGSWTNSPTSYTYAWKRNGSTISTSSTYTTVSADSVYNTSLSFEVTAINGSGFGVASSLSIDIIVNMATFVNKYWTAANSFTDTGATTIVTNNSPVRVLKGLVTAGATTSNNNLAFIGTTTGKAQKESNGNTYGSTVPYPKYYSGDSFIHIVNTLPQRYETGVLGNISGAFTGFFLMRLLGGTSNEYYLSASNTFSLRDRNNDHLEIGKWNTAVEYSNGSGVPDNYKLQLFEIERNSTGGTRLWINQMPYAGGAVINTGSNNMTEFAISSNSHNTDNMFHAAGYIAGARNSVKSDQIRKALESKYGALNSYPSTFPIATFDAGDSLIWNNSLNRIELPSYTFRSPHGDSEGATEIRWYSGSTSIVLSCENRTYIKTQVKGVDSEFGRLYRGSDFGTNPETVTSRYYNAEIIAVDGSGRRQVMDIKTKFLIDNVT